MLQSAPVTPSPRNGPRVRVGEGRPDRVLLIGNGVLHGWGVRLREMSAPGHLATLLHRQTGRAAAVELIGEERMNTAAAVDWLGDAATRGHDVAVICLGLNDALRLTPLHEWRQQMVRLLDRVRRDQAADARILLVGLPHVRRFTMADSALGSVAQRHADQMDLILQELAYGRHTSFVPAPEELFEPGRALGSSSMYEAWARQLVPPVLADLETIRRMRPPVPVPAETWDWSGTPAALEADGTSAMQRLDELTEELRHHYGVASAAVNVLDGAQVHSVAGRGGGPRWMPRSLAYCDRTVRQDAVTVVKDADRDPEFQDNPFLDVVGLPFYAGVPLHASDGRPIATLCMLDTDPRSTFDPTRLLQLAHEAERELRKFETTSGPQLPAPQSSTATPVKPGGIPAGLKIQMLALLLKPLIGAALKLYLRDQARPDWDARAITEGPLPIRVLVIGGGLAVGYGSTGEDDPLPHQLGAAITAATGRGVVVEMRAQASLRLTDTLLLVGGTGAATFDHVVWSPTLEEAARSSARSWSRQLRRVVLALRESGSHDMQLLLLGVPLIQGTHFLHPVGQFISTRINTRTRAVAYAFDRTTYLSVPARAVTTANTPLYDHDYRSTITQQIAAALLTNRQAERAPRERSMR